MPEQLELWCAYTLVGLREQLKPEQWIGWLKEYDVETALKMYEILLKWDDLATITRKGQEIRKYRGIPLPLKYTVHHILIKYGLIIGKVGGEHSWRYVIRQQDGSWEIVARLKEVPVTASE